MKDKKDRSSRPKGSYKWAVCIDGSDQSIKAIDIVAKIIDKEKD